MNVPIVNQPPTLNAITNLIINENAGLQTVSLSGITSGATNENQTLTVTAVSSNTGLIPNPTVNYTSANTTGSLTFTPVTNVNGTATITVTVNDGGTSNSNVTQTFTVTVNAGNQPPTLNAISDLNIYESAGSQTVSLSGITSGAANENQKLAVTAVSSNTGLIHNPTIKYTSPKTNGTLTFTPVANKTGTAAITVTVKDGGASNNIVTQTFTVTVIAPPLPTFDVINDITISKDAAQQTNMVTGISCVATNENPKLKLTAKTSNLLLMYSLNLKVNYHSPDATATLTFKPTSKMTGTTIITVTLQDSARKINNTFTRTFAITVLSNMVATPSVAVQEKTDSTNSATDDSSGGPAPVTLESLGYANGQYALTVAGAPGYETAASGTTYVIEASTNLVNWIPVHTNTAPFTFVDADAGQFSQRFYRAVAQYRVVAQ